jgi:hypothetical protein
MNAKNIADYLANPTHCVNCGSNQVGTGSPVMLTEGAIQVEVGCQDCGATWTDNFKIAAVSNLTTPQPKEYDFPAFVVTYANGATSENGSPMLAGSGMAAPGENITQAIQNAMSLGPWQAVERFVITAQSEGEAVKSFREFVADKVRALMTERGMDPSDLRLVGDPMNAFDNRFEDAMGLLRRYGLVNSGDVDRDESAA